MNCPWTPLKLTSIGVVSSGALGHVPLDFQPFSFSGHFTAAQTDMRLNM